jgi:hypothetical protein
MITASELLISILLIAIPTIFLLVARKSDKRYRGFMD